METRRSRRQGNRSTVKVKVAKEGLAKQNELCAKGDKICKDNSEVSATVLSKSVSKKRDVLQDINKADHVHENSIIFPQAKKSKKESIKRKISVEEKPQVRKVTKKEKSDTIPSCSNSGKDLKLSDKEMDNDTQAAAKLDVALEIFRDSQTSQKQQKGKKKTKGTDPMSKDSSNCSPGKPNLKKLKQKAALVNETNEQDMSLEEKKIQPMKLNQIKGKPSDGDLSIRDKVLKSLDGAEDLKKKGKSPVKDAWKDKCSLPSHMDSENSEDDGNDSEMDWEDVAEADVGVLENNDDGNSWGDTPSSSSNVEVTINVPGKKKRGGQCIQEELRKCVQRRINQLKKESQICAHKVHLLALLANGLRRNDLCNNLILQGIGLSLVPSLFTQRTVPKAWDMSFLTRIATWFKNKAPYPGEIHTGHSEGTYLIRVLEKKVYFFVVILRALGLSARLVMSLQAMNIKVNDSNGGKNLGVSETPKVSKGKQKKEKGEKQKEAVKKEQKKNPRENLLNKMKGKSTPKPKRTVGSTSTATKTLRKRSKVDYTMQDSDTTTESEYFQKDKKSQKEKKCSGESSSAYFPIVSDDEVDFETPSKTTRRNTTSSKELNRRSLELAENLQDVGKSSSVPKRGIDIWVEVYLEKEKKWICIDGDAYSVNQTEECEKHTTKPIKYVVAFDNENCIKDVTARYASGWLTSTPKLRVDPKWWTDTVDFYKTEDLKRDKKEDSRIKANLLRKPLPTSVNEYKNHPLYVLQRHLLKFEGIYPETAATLGFCRTEPVYSRDCVHSLHTRELWMKEARVVKSGEEAYKIVKGRKSKRKMLENVGEITAELFGKWQTEDYVPPPVVDGKIPRNEYGNVELFKPSMLPPGSCHIQVPGIHRLARKLNIDAVPAVVGFEFHCGFSHPVIDGVVVCEENKDVLLDAWNVEQEEKIKREQEKREKRVMDNWVHLVRSLRIRERLKRKYNMEDEPDVKQKKDETQNLDETGDVITDVSLSWPLNRQEGKSTRADNGHCHVFLETNYRQDEVTGEWDKVCSCGQKEPL